MSLSHEAPPSLAKRLLAARGLADLIVPIVVPFAADKIVPQGVRRLGDDLLGVRPPQSMQRALQNLRLISVQLFLSRPGRGALTGRRPVTVPTKKLTDVRLRQILRQEGLGDEDMGKDRRKFFSVKKCANDFAKEPKLWK